MSRPLNIFRVILLISSLILIFGYHLVFTSLTYAAVVPDAELRFFGFAVNGGFLIDVILTLLILIHIILILTMVK